MSVTNIVRAVVKPGSDYTVTSPIMKEDKGQVLLIEGLDLPEVYEIDFSNDRHHGSSITMIGNAEGVLIPTQFIKTGRDVFAFYYYVGDGFGQTVYGGKLDVLSGVLTVTHKGVDMGALSWTRQEGTGKQLWRFYTAGIANDVSREQTLVSRPLMLDLKAPFLVPNAEPVYNRNVDNAMCVLCASGAFYATCSLYTSAADFKAAVTGMILVYRLATPITIQLTPNQVNSLLGVNNLWADSGDTKLFIERLTAPDSADMIADSNITSGQYFMVGNNLYKATANIANGGQITVGTNCTRVSLAQALNEINA